jgi:2-C-methyl-D-erythritol 4-phosphate cytidylyltransferase
MKIFVIIPAAGLGTRMGWRASGERGRAGPVKQFAELGGVPILLHTLRRFTNRTDVHQVYVALRAEDVGAFREQMRQEPSGRRVSAVEGGDTRQQSVKNALSEIKGDAGDLVVVHDAVRPLVDDEIITAVIEAAARYGAAIAGIPAVDTIKNVDRTAEGAVVTSTVPRERVVLAQTPQAFRYQVIKNAFDQAAADGFTGTDEASIVERSGQEVAVVMGSPRNIKITTPGDLELAEFYLSQDLKRVAG